MAGDLEAAIVAAIGYQAVDVETDDNGYDGGGLIRAVSLDHLLLILGLPARCYPLEQPARLKAFVEKQQIYVHEQFESMLGTRRWRRGARPWSTAPAGTCTTPRAPAAPSRFTRTPAYYPAILPRSRPRSATSCAGTSSSSGSEPRPVTASTPAADATTGRPVVPAVEAILGRAYPVLDHGFIRVVDYMGDDAAVVQAARVSYGAGTRRVREGPRADPLPDAPPAHDAVRDVAPSSST